MPKKFEITPENYFDAHEYIHKNVDVIWWMECECDDYDHSYQAKRAFDDLAEWSDKNGKKQALAVKELQKWYETFLNQKGKVKIQNALRAATKRRKRDTVTVGLTDEAWRILRREQYAERVTTGKQPTFSELIIKRLG